MVMTYHFEKITSSSPERRLSLPSPNRRLRLRLAWNYNCIGWIREGLTLNFVS